MEYQEGPSQYTSADPEPSPSPFEHDAFLEPLSDISSDSDSDSDDGVDEADESDEYIRPGQLLVNIESFVRMGEVLRDRVEDDELIRPGVEEGNKGESGFERSGVTHLVHAWHPQGHQRKIVSLHEIYLC
jgi:hypothetical protein